MFSKKKINYHDLIEVSRTKSVNYQSTRIAVGFLCPPEVNYSEGFKLAEFLVEARISGEYYMDEAQAFEYTYSVIFPGDSIHKYLRGLKLKVDDNG